MTDGDPQNSLSLSPDDALTAHKLELNAQTAVIAWRDLQRYFAAGVAIFVAPQLDLVDVACQVALDNGAQVAAWMAGDELGPVSDPQARKWFDDDALVWSVVVKPWVLVQPHSPARD